MVARAAESTLLPHFAVEVVDTIGASDAFAAEFAVGLTEEKDFPGAARFANACGRLATTALGAQSALLHRVVVDQLAAETLGEAP